MKAFSQQVIPILVLQALGSAVGRRRGEHGVVAGPEPQRGGLSWAGVRAELRGELVGHGGARGQDGSAVEQSWREIPAETEGLFGCAFSICSVFFFFYKCCA